MSTQAGGFRPAGDQSLVSMQPARFASEADFQGLLARFPEVLVGDQIDPEGPRRWVLVKREQAVGLDQAEGALVHRPRLPRPGRHSHAGRDQAVSENLSILGGSGP